MSPHPRVAHPLRLGSVWSRPCGDLGRFGNRQGRFRKPTRPMKERDVMNLINYLRRLLRNESGQDLLEYALLVALIALVCVAVVTSTGSGVKTIFSNISSALSSAATP
jgi:pilus assembly protein Flp/PilA